jgi:uncharacterized protein
MEEPRSNRQILTYLLFVLLFSSVFYFLIIRAKHLGAGGGNYVFGLMWCPALAAFATLRLNGRRLRDLGWKWPATKYALLSWFIPLFYATIAYTIVWTSGLGGFPNPDMVKRIALTMGAQMSPTIALLTYVLLAGTFGVVRSMASALGEEIGWRGFLVPELAKKVSFTTTAVTSGVVWSLWHYPILIFADYNAGTNTWYALTCFTVLVIAISFVFAWMRLKSGSLWTGAILHASHNLFVQAVFTPLTANRGKTAWYIDEFGAVLPLVAICFAIYFWSRRGELKPQETAATGA